MCCAWTRSSGSDYARGVPPLVLRRSDIGFGRVIVDDRGITRDRLIRTSFLAWEDIRDYRMTVEIRGGKLEVLYLLDWVNLLLIARDVARGLRGDHRFRLGLELIGDRDRVFFNWRFRGVAMAIDRVLGRIAPPFAATARATLAREGLVRFGPLTLAADGVQWNELPPLPRERVETIELFNSSPVRLRVMARDKPWPYGQANTADIPNLAAVLQIAEQLGYRVRGRELLVADV